MKFAFVLFRYFPFGGMQRNMMSIAKACHDHGHDIEIICSEWLDDLPPEFKITCLSVDKSKNNGVQMEAFFQAFSNYREQEHRQYDAVVGFNKFPHLDVYYAADSCFATKAFEERTWLYRLTKRTKIYLKYEKAVFGSDSNTKILEVSGKERKQFQKHYQTVDDRFISLPPGISKTRVASEDALKIRKEKREELYKTLGFNEGSKILLAIGSGYKTKGLERSIHLMAGLKKDSKNNNKSYILLVAGKDKADKFMRLAKALDVDDRVKFLGGRDDIPELLQAADLVLHPAHKENTGNVLLESMVAGRPVVATEVCGYAYYIEDANMGAVIKSPFLQESYRAAVESVLAVDDSVWRDRGKIFSQQEEIYSRPEFVVNVLEKITAGAR